MRSVLIIGIERSRQHLCKNLVKCGNQIMAMDISEEELGPILPYVIDARVGDRTNEVVLRNLGIGNFDICFICIGNSFQDSLEATSMIKEMEVKYAVSKANRNVHTRLLLKNGTDRVVYPDRDVAERTAVHYNDNSVFGYTELADGISIFEICPLDSWVGESTKDLNIWRVHNISIIALEWSNGHMKFVSGTDYVIEDGVHLIVIGSREDAERVVKKLSQG